MEADSVITDFTHNSSNEEWVSFSAPKNPIWVCNTESRVVHIAKDILSVLIFPIGIARVLHRIVGYFIMPAAFFTRMYALIVFITKIPVMGTYAIPIEASFRKRLLLRLENVQNTWNVQRISIHVDGRVVDAAIVAKKDQACQNNRWTLLSGGETSSFSDLSDLDLVDKLKSNAVYYNYPGVMGSTGSPSRSGIATTSRVMLQFLEERLGAKEIIWYGHGFGGGAQEVFPKHTKKDGVRYCLVKDSTFSCLSKVFNLEARVLVQVFGWNMSLLASVNGTPQVIIPRSNISKTLRPDLQISKEASLEKVSQESAITKILSIPVYITSLPSEQIQQSDQLPILSVSLAQKRNAAKAHFEKITNDLVEQVNSLLQLPQVSSGVS